jgi:hypothetical protein
MARWVRVRIPVYELEGWVPARGREWLAVAPAAALLTAVAVGLSRVLIALWGL